MRRLTGIAGLLLGTALTTTGLPAFAQAAEGADEGGIADIVVTAQRREERLQDVPIAISAFTQEDLTKNDIRDISRLTQFTPGFNFGQSGFDTRPAIRGVRTVSVDGNGDPAIGYYIDDIYQSLAVQGSAPIVDVSRVEIARGPQGTLFGRNTFGGAISVVSATPTSDLGGGADLTIGNYERVQFRGFVNLPVSETFGLRIAGQREIRDGYVKNIDNPGNDIYDRDSEYLRVTARWAPTDSLEVILRGNYWSEGGTGAGAFGYKNGGVIVNPNYTAAPGQPKGLLSGTPFFFFFGRPVDGVPDINGLDIGQFDSSDPYEWRGAFRPSVDLKQYATSGQIRWSNDDIFVRSVTGYQDFKYDSNTGEPIGSPTTEYIAVRNTKTFSQELQIGSVGKKPLEWIIGAYYLNDKYFDAFIIDDSGVNVFSQDQVITTNSYAVYGQASYYVTEQLRLTAGGRYTVDDKKFFGRSGDGTDLALFGTLDRERKFKKFTWRVGAEAFLTQENLVYASVSTGFRSGGFNGTSLFDPLVPSSFDAEKITAYEIGSKNRFLDGKLQFNASAYYNDFKDLQTQNQFTIPGSTVSSSGVLNAGAARTYGLELETIIRPVPELTLNATAAIVNARFKDYAFRGRPSAFYPIEDVDLSGNRLGNTPDVKFTAGFSYDIVIPGAGIITPRANMVYSGKYYTTDYNTVIDRQKAYATVDAGLGWASEDGSYSVEAFVTNLTNKAVLNYAAFGSQTLLTSYEPPRFYGVRLSFRQ